MRILLTNDDGINAPGLAVLEEIARALSEDVWVVAPETDQSGASHSLTLADPLRMRPLGGNRFAVRGTPTDCVIMGIRRIMPEPPDLVLSGVNSGQNLADDVTYSGTVAGAMEGTLLGVRSFALSQAHGQRLGGKRDFSVAAQHGAAVLKQLLAMEVPPGALFNINFPAGDPRAVKGSLMTVQGKRDPGLLSIDERTDGRGTPYYWIAFKRQLSAPLDGTDMHAVDNGWISVTPLRLDLTDHGLHSRMRESFRAHQKAD